jgi:HK97 family phage portal protein
MSIIDTFLSRRGYVKAAQTRKLSDLEAATALSEKYQLPDTSIYGNQAELYRRLSWVMTAVEMVANSCAAVPFNVKQRSGQDLKDIPNHDFEVLLDKPNSEDSGFEFIFGTVAMYKLTGNAYWWLNKADENAEPDEMWVIPSHMIKPLPDEQMYLRGYNYNPGGGAKDIPLEPWEVVHFKRWNPFSRFMGLSAIEALAMISAGDLGMQDWNTRLFKENNARLPGILAFADFVQEPEWSSIKRDTREKAAKREMMMLRGVGKGGVEWMQSAVSHRDMEFLAGRKFTMEEIFGALAPGLSSILAVNATEANALAGRATYNELTVFPVHMMLSKKVTHQVLPIYGENLVGEFDDVRVTDRQLELSEMQEYDKTHTINEIRKVKYNDQPLPDKDPRGEMFVFEIGTRTTVQGTPPEPGQPATETSAPGAAAANLPTAKKMANDPVTLDLRRWERKALKKVGEAVPFESSVIPIAVKANISKQLPCCPDEKAIKTLFQRTIEKEISATNGDPVIAALLEGIRLEVTRINNSQG